MEETRNAPYIVGEDRISGLYDHLIHHILSFIDTKYAVQTRVLSKRWMDIWKTLPFLHFNRRLFSDDKKDCFIMFVDMVLCFREDSDIQRFCVEWRDSVFDQPVNVIMNVNRWSLAAVKYNVQEIIVVISRCRNLVYEIPHRLLNCKSLRKLVLDVLESAEYLDIVLPRSMNLPQLKILGFTGLSISNVESSKRLFSSCPVLERLHTYDCNIKTDNQRNLVVDSPILKEFGYSRWRRYVLPQDDTRANTIKLCAPKLRQFTCGSFFKNEYSLEIYSPLKRACFYMRLDAEYEDEDAETYEELPSKEKDVYAKRVVKFLGAVHMVKAMRLSTPGFLEVLSRAPDLLDCGAPRLCNLGRLGLEMWFTRGSLRAIAYLLKISPNITHLVVLSKESNLADVGDDWEAGLSSPGMLSHLENVLVKGVQGCDAELKLLSFLLKTAKVLKKVSLLFRSSVGSPDGVRQFKDKLRSVPTASSSIKWCL